VAQRPHMKESIIYIYYLTKWCSGLMPAGRAGNMNLVASHGKNF
jgi:hypothetical protein